MVFSELSWFVLEWVFGSHPCQEDCSRNELSSLCSSSANEVDNAVKDLREGGLGLELKPVDY